MGDVDIDPNALHRLPDDELEQLEDRLLLEVESDVRRITRTSAGRLALIALTLLYLGPLAALAVRLGGGFGSGYGLGVLLFIAAHLLLLGAAVVAAWLTWKTIGLRGRVLVRGALHYWPVTFWVVGACLAWWSRS